MIIHRAWTFRPSVFHSTIAAQVVVEGALDSELLWREANNICMNPSAEMLAYLEMVRADLDDVLIADDPPEADHYVICMAPYLTPAPSMRGGITHFLEWL